jgi:hypothetical protein
MRYLLEHHFKAWPRRGRQYGSIWLGGSHKAIVRQTIVIIGNLSSKDFAERMPPTDIAVPPARSLEFPRESRPAGLSRLNQHEFRFRTGEVTAES